MTKKSDAPLATTSSTHPDQVLHDDRSAPAAWADLIAYVATCADRDVSASSDEAQDLAWRWLRLLEATRNSIAGRNVQSIMLHEAEGGSKEIAGITSPTIAWLNLAFTQARVSLLAKYVSASEVEPLRDRLIHHAAEWQHLAAQVQQKMAAGLPPADPSVQSLAAQWGKLFRASYCGDDPVLEQKIQTAFDQEPDLLLVVGLSADVIAYVQRAILRSRLSPGGYTGQDEAAPKPSAYMVATQRAAHQLLDTPLILEDAIAVKILGADGEAALRKNLQHYGDPMARGMRTSLVVRSRLAEDQWHAAWQGGVRQYVILGAGLDTYAYRAGDRADRQIFEVDLPATQNWKRDCLRQADISAPASLIYVPVDFQQGTLADGLNVAGFRHAEPAFFSWLGVTLYLDEQDVIDTLRYIASCAAGSSVIFDYATSPTLLSPLDRIGLEIISKQTAERGEPWKSHFDPDTLADLLHQLGFGKVDHFDAMKLTDRYLTGRNDGLRLGSITRLIQATV